MRVLHVVPALFGPLGVVGGAERYVHELARHMADRTATTLLTFGDTAMDEQQDALRVRVLDRPWRVRGQSGNPFALRALAAMREADVVHCHQQHILVSSAMAIAGRIARRPVFVTDLGGGGWDFSGYMSTDSWYRGHLHISEYSRRHFGHTELASARVILGGVDIERFSPDPDAQRSRAVFVGRLLPHKGVDDLIAGLPDGIGADIIGRPYDAAYAADLRRLATGKDVRFMHDATDDDIVHAYRTALCVVLPSVYLDRYGQTSWVPELLGQTLLEGMSCGAPGICTDVASMPEIVQDGVSGFVVPPNDPAAIGDRLRLLASDPARLRQMSAAARARVESNFVWPAVVERCLEAYRALG